MVAYSAAARAALLALKCPYCGHAQARVRKPKDLAVLIEIAAWREREAQARDVPRGRVLKDDVLADVATQAPTTLERLSHLRSLPKGFERSRWGQDVIDAVKRGLDRDPRTLPALERQRSNGNGAIGSETDRQRPARGAQQRDRSTEIKTGDLAKMDVTSAAIVGEACSR